jgi:hypothetical protein
VLLPPTNAVHRPQKYPQYASKSAIERQKKLFLSEPIFTMLSFVIDDNDTAIMAVGRRRRRKAAFIAEKCARKGPKMWIKKFDSKLLFTTFLGGRRRGKCVLNFYARADINIQKIHFYRFLGKLDFSFLSICGCCWCCCETTINGSTIKQIFERATLSANEHTHSGNLCKRASITESSILIVIDEFYESLEIWQFFFVNVTSSGLGSCEQNSWVAEWSSILNNRAIGYCSHETAHKLPAKENTKEPAEIMIENHGHTQMRSPHDNTLRQW